MTPDEIEDKYHRLSKSWQTLTRADKTVAAKELGDMERIAGGLNTEDGDELSAAVHRLRADIRAELELPEPDEDMGLPVP